MAYQIELTENAIAELKALRAFDRRRVVDEMNAMKETTLERFVQDVQELMEDAQHERILVTRDGTPFAVVVGIAHKDQEDLRLESSPEFWRMIEERRRDPTVRLEDVETELLADEP